MIVGVGAGQVVLATGEIGATRPWTLPGFGPTHRLCNRALVVVHHLRCAFATNPGGPPR